MEKIFDHLSLNEEFDYDVFYDGRELLRYEENNHIQYKIYILDIEMKNLDGISAAKIIRERNPSALIVFLTSYSEYVYDVFEVLAFDFVKKPMTEAKIINLFKRIQTYLNINCKCFNFAYRKRNYSVEFEDILYLEKCGHKVYVYSNHETLECNMSTKELLKKLDKQIFCQIHNSYIVNLKYVRKIANGYLSLNTGAELKISRQFYKTVKEKHFEFIMSNIT